MIYDLQIKLDEIEKQYIFQALDYFKGNKLKTAKALFISRDRLDRKIVKYNIECKNFKIKKDKEHKIEKEMV